MQVKPLQDKYQRILSDNRTRSFLKAISYRIISMFITVIISFAITKSYGMSFAIGGIDFMAKIIFYYLHERIWHYSKIGRIKESNKKKNLGD